VLSQLSETQAQILNQASKKKSLFSRLTPNQGKLFTALSAKDWRDYDPELNVMTKQLMEDRDGNKIANLAEDWKKIGREEWQSQACSNFSQKGTARRNNRVGSRCSCFTRRGSIPSPQWSWRKQFEAP
jgi:hypothetical protein